MIIQSSRLSASKGATETADHVFRGEANEKITVLQGSEQDLHDMVRDARIWRRKFAIRHFKISPRENLTREQFDEAVNELAHEFAFDPSDAVIIGHKKKRHNETGFEFHTHVLVREVNPANGRVLSSRWSYARQEKVARVLEARWGHAIVQGQFNKQVIDALRAEGRDDDAALLLGEGLDVEALPQAAYPSGLVQEVKRRANRSMAEIAEAVRDARHLSNTPTEFQDILAEQGLRVRAGDKTARWVVEIQTPEAEWTFAGALHRLLKSTTQDTDKWMGGWNPAQNFEGEKHDENEGEDMGSDGVRRAARRRGRARHAANGRPPRNDARYRGGSGIRVSHEPPDGTAGQSRAHRGRERNRPHRGNAGRNGGAAENHEREAGRDNPHPLPPRSQSGGEGWEGQADHAARLTKLMAYAALEQRFGEMAKRRWLDDQASAIRRPDLTSPAGINRTIRGVEADGEVRARKLKFRTMLIRRAYALNEWLDPAIVLNIARVDADGQGKFVLLTLTNGAQLLDTGDRITVRGEADDITIGEMVACVERRGWSVVEVSGDLEFRMAASRELILLGIEVLDCPLSALEIQEILRSNIREGSQPILAMR